MRYKNAVVCFSFSLKNANFLVSRIDYDGGFTFYSLTVEVSDSIYSVDVPVAVEVRMGSTIGIAL